MDEDLRGGRCQLQRIDRLRNRRASEIKMIWPVPAADAPSPTDPVRRMNPLTYAAIGS